MKKYCIKETGVIEKIKIKGKSRREGTTAFKALSLSTWWNAQNIVDKMKRHSSLKKIKKNKNKRFKLNRRKKGREEK